MDIYNLLPLLDGWKWTERKIDGFVSPTSVEPGSSFQPVPLIRGRGWVTGLGVWVDNPHVRLIFRYDEMEINVTPQRLFLTRQIQPRNVGMWLSIYDTVSIPRSILTLLTPSSPIPYRTDLECFLINPPAQLDGTPNVTTRVYFYYLATIEIVDETLFREGMKRALG